MKIEQTKNIDGLIKICAKISGITYELTSEDFSIIKLMLKNDFGNMSGEEMVEAFRMNSSGKYWEVIEAFQTFSPIFVGKVLREYREFRRKRNLIKPIELKELPRETNDITGERAFATILKIWRQEKQLPMIASWNKAFKHLEKEGMITISNEEKAAIYEAEKAKVESEISKLRSMMMDSSKLMKDLNKIYLQIQSRKTCIKNYLEKNHPIDA